MNLVNIARNALKPAFGLMEEDSQPAELVIEDGDPWQCVRNDRRIEGDYDGGQQIDKFETAVGDTAEFEAIYSGTEESYRNKLCTLAGNEMRIQSVNKDAAFTTVLLIGKEQAA